jgi:hypothetical protein
MEVMINDVIDYSMLVKATKLNKNGDLNLCENLDFGDFSLRGIG